MGAVVAVVCGVSLQGGVRPAAHPQARSSLTGPEVCRRHIEELMVAAATNALRGAALASCHQQADELAVLVPAPRGLDEDGRPLPVAGGRCRARVWVFEGF